MTDCPAKLRGDLTKWLCEINTGVYVGNLNSRVRDAIWRRVCQNLKSGRATMVFSANNEQKMDFRVHNSSWMPVDFDGIQLMRRPLPGSYKQDNTLKAGFSNAAKRQMSVKKRQTTSKNPDSYVIIDLETTGLNESRDVILEFGAIRVEEGIQVEKFSRLVMTDHPIPKAIRDLTGIDEELLKEEGEPLEKVLTDFLKFIGEGKLIGYNITFDMLFLQEACKACKKAMPNNVCIDLKNQVRKKIFGLTNYNLRTVAESLSLDVSRKHRAYKDCEIMLSLYDKLNEN